MSMLTGYPSSYTTGPRHYDHDGGPPVLLPPYQPGTPEEEEELALLQRLERGQTGDVISGHTDVPKIEKGMWELMGGESQGRPGQEAWSHGIESEDHAQEETEDMSSLFQPTEPWNGGGGEEADHGTTERADSMQGRPGVTSSMAGARLPASAGHEKHYEEHSRMEGGALKVAECG